MLLTSLQRPAVASVDLMAGAVSVKWTSAMSRVVPALPIPAMRLLFTKEADAVLPGHHDVLRLLESHLASGRPSRGLQCRLHPLSRLQVAHALPQMQMLL